MNTRVPQSALREWRGHMVNPARAIALVGTAAILALMGPFNTGEVMRALPRLGYWLVLVGLGYTAGYAANAWADRVCPRNVTARIAVAGPLTGVLVLALVYLLNGAALGFWASGAELGWLALNVIAISIIIAAVFQVAYSKDQTETSAAPPPLLDRIPFDKRGALVSISVEDHYVRIRTSSGEDMVLLRLADAIREVGSVAGLQVHRSHWVAQGQITSVTRKGDGAVLSMTTGPDIPVSRSNVNKIKELGLLPKSNG